MIKGFFIGCTLALAGISAIAQQTDAVVTYGFRNNGKEGRGEQSLLIQGKRVTVVPNGRQTELQYLSYADKATYQLLQGKGGTFTLKKPFGEYVKPELLPGIDTVAGIPCKKAKAIIRSNTIEIWYTDALAIKGSPQISIAPGLGLILKIVRNGNSETFAKKVEYRKVTNEELKWPASWGKLVSEPAYQRQVIDSRYATLPIFEQEQISWGNKIDNPTGYPLNATYHFAGGTVILKKINLPAVKGGQRLFAELVQYSNGDAYDRTGSVFVVPTDKARSFLEGLEKGAGVLPSFKGRNGKTYQGYVSTDDYNAPLEVMRFFTPFGVRQFNKQVQIEGYNWADSAVFKQDITDLSPRLQGDVYIGIYIGNYDKGGHKASLSFKYYPGYDGGEGRPEPKKWVQPVFNSTNVMEMAGQEYATFFDQDSLTVTVEVPQGVKNLKLRYITTGHGGWGGGDEFNPKLNEIFVDGQRAYHFFPWREDCATYRLLNPASGNFGNGLSSSDLSRSNWCPGTLTLPVDVPLPQLTPGKHTIQVTIPLGKPEGGSFSFWNVSGVLIGDQE